jgi:molecular chaperone DnaJ
VQHSPSARAARRGRDQRAEVTVGFAEAVYGTTAVVTLPEAGGATRDVEVRVPAGTADGDRLHLAGLGGAGEGGGRPGDLRVTVRVQPHARYAREDSDLALTVPVTFPEAVLGATVDLPGLSGERLALRVPPGTRSGAVLRLTGHGVPTNNGTGDLLVTIIVDVPDHLSSESRHAIADLARRLPDPRAHWRAP